MINDLESEQANSKHGKFAKALCQAMLANNIKLSASVLAREFNKRFEGYELTPGTARNWLIGTSKPRKPVLSKLSTWLKLDAESLEVKPSKAQKLSYTFDFEDQEVIAKYLAMTEKQKVTVRLLIKALTEKDRQN